MEAASQQNEQLVQALWDARAELGIRDAKGHTVLVQAAVQNHLDVAVKLAGLLQAEKEAQVLLSSGTSPNEALIGSVTCNQPLLTDALVRCGCKCQG